MIYRIRQNFRGEKLSRLCTKHTIHWKTFAVHQAHTIMYCIYTANDSRGKLSRLACRIRYYITEYAMASSALLANHEMIFLSCLSSEIMTCIHVMIAHSIVLLCVQLYYLVSVLVLVNTFNSSTW